MTDYDLVIVGAGSGNSLIGPEMDSWRIAIVERDLFGGTCMNRGCIPTKMFVHTAHVADTARDAKRFGVDAEFHAADWAGIVNRIFGRIDPIAEAGLAYREGLDNVDVYTDSAYFVGPRTLQVGDRTISGRQVVIAAGARPHIPEGIPGLDPSRGPVVPFHTSDTVMRIDTLPEHLVILGAGFVSCEMASIFHGLGSKVTVVLRGPRLLRSEDVDIATRYTEIAARDQEVVFGAQLIEVTGDERETAVHVDVDGQRRTMRGDVLLVATGRTPNGDQLNAAAGGVELDAEGAVVVDQYGRTTAEGVWALGDVNGRYQLKHMANGEARVVRHNLSHPGDLRPLDQRPAPHGVFTNPQIGAVGLTEAEARAEHGDDAVCVTQAYGAAAYGWALEDTDGFVKLIGQRSTRRLLGAHVIGYQATTLVQQVVQGMHLGHTVDELAEGQIWIHPGLPEVIEQALIALAEAM